MKHDILVVDDEKDIRDLISGILEDEGFETRVAASGTEALKEIQKRQPNLVILDVWLGDSERDGLKILEQIKRDHPYVPVIMISGHGTIETAVSAIKNGAYDFIEKPFKTERLLLCVERAIESSRLKRENDHFRQMTQNRYVTIGQSQSAQRIRQEIERMADLNSRVFIEGAFGSGKESIACEIHEKSSRADHPFIIFHCGNISPMQLEAELFGTEIVGLSKNQPRKIGLLEQAHKGTLYFEEITLLPLPVQAKLVRVLHDETFSRIGSDEKISINVRFMAGSSFNTAKAIADGNLREDLYYRMNVCQFHVPSLVDRLQDLPIMIEAILKSVSQAQGFQIKRVSEEALAFLQMHHWPRNIHELQNTLETALINANDGTKDPIQVMHLPVELVQGRGQLNKMGGNTDIVILPIKEARELFEREYLQAQVNRFSGNITQTAKFIGMERSALHRKLKALGLEDVRDTID